MSDIKDAIKGLWVEEYRPKSIYDMVYCNDHEMLFKNIVEKEELPHLMLFGTRAGGGKTSTAWALIRDLGVEYMFINGSVSTSKGMLDKGGKIDSFLNCESEHTSKHPYKVVFIDEIDGTSDEFKKGFKGFIEEYSDRARFICTTNFIGDMNEYEGSRMVNVSFDYTETQMAEIFPKFFNRMKMIVGEKEIPINAETGQALQYIAKENAPDMRKTIQHMFECYLKFGTLDMRCKEITIEDEDDKLIEILFDTDVSITERYHQILKIFKSNPTIVSRVTHIINERFIPILLDELKEEDLFITTLEDIAECDKYYKTHPQKHILLKSLLVQLMVKIGK